MAKLKDTTIEKATTGGQNQIAFKEAGTTKTQITSNYGDDKFYLYHEGDNRLVIDSSGNIGLGTSSPLEKLQVNGDITVDRNATGRGATITLANGSEAVNNYSALMFGNVNAHSGYRKGAIAYRSDGTGFGRGDIYFLQRTDANSSNAELSHHAMVIKNSGKVGIGANSPDGKLTVAQAMTNGGSAFSNPHLVLKATNTVDSTGFVGMTMATSTSDNYGWSFGAQRTSSGIGDLYWRNHSSTSAGNDRMMLTSGGNLGIGTTSPSTKMHISESGTATALTVQNASSNGTVVKLTSTGDNRSLYLQTDHIYSNGNLYFGDNSYETIIRGSDVKIEGDILLNTPVNDSAPISVKSLSNGRAIHIEETGTGSESWQIGVDTAGNMNFMNSGSGTPSIRFFDNNYVAIGVSTPTEMLEVGGKVKASNGKLASVEYTNSGTTTEVDTINFDLNGSTLTITTS